MRSLFLLMMTTALRDRLFLSIFLLLILAHALAYGAALTLLVEQVETRVVLAANLSRLIIVIGSILYTCSIMGHESQRALLTLALTRPSSRLRVYAQYWIAFAALGVILCAVSALSLIPGTVLSGWSVWQAGVLLEVLMVCSLALAFSVWLHHTTSAALLSLASYGLLRLLAAGYSISHSTLQESNALTGTARQILGALHFLLPDLNHIAQSEWLIYGVPDTVSAVPFLAALLFIPVLFCLGMTTFIRAEY